MVSGDEWRRQQLVDAALTVLLRTAPHHAMADLRRTLEEFATSPPQTENVPLADGFPRTPRSVLTDGRSMAGI